MSTATTTDLLDIHTARAAVKGFTVETRAPSYVILTRRAPVNHVLHGVLTIATFGLWAVVWVTLAGRKPLRLTVEKLPDDHVRVSRLWPSGNATVAYEE